MRRVTLVAAGPEGRAAESWLRGVAGISTIRVERLAELALETTDAVWLHGAGRFALPSLVDWLRAGGRLLATLDAAMLPFDLGLETEPPDDQVDAVWREGPALLGLAAPGPRAHPLFDGLDGGAYLWAASTGESYRRCVYRRARPARGRVVGVEWRPDDLDPASALAWEYTVGAGGVLCLGALVQVDPVDWSRLPELRHLLANALVGDAVPHRERRSVVAFWPARREAPRLDPSLAVPAFPVFDGARPADVPSAMIGRRLGVELLPDGAHVRAPGLSLLESARVEASDGRRPAQRWLVAHELPMAVWELIGDGRVELTWTTDLAAGGPLGVAVRDRIRYAVSADGTRACVALPGGESVVLAAVGAHLSAAPEGTAVRFRGEGKGRVCLLLVGANDEADLARTLRLVARDGWSGALAQGERHRLQVLRSTIQLEAPDPSLGDALQAAVLAGDARVIEVPAVGRVVADEPGGRVMTTAIACRTAASLAAAGHRATARELLRALLGARDFAGRVPDRIYESGLTEWLDGSGAAAAKDLARCYLAWTGDAERVAALLPDADVRPDAPPDSAPARDVIGRVLDQLWGIVPDAPRAAIALRPRLPDGWQEMQLTKLRVGESTLELDCRRRPDSIMVRVRRTHGPPVTLTVGLRDAYPTGLAVDEIELGGTEARFVAEGSHEVQFRIDPSGV